MDFLLIIPFIVQALCIGIDESYFHIKRGLPKWERIGHPLDTLSVIACLLFVLWIPYSPFALKWYITLGIVSCLMITKDEWVHKHHCPAAEHWLHALLFVNHSLVLIATGLIWWGKWITHPESMHYFLGLQVALIAIFFLYQVIYWNFIWKEPNVENQ